MIESFADVPVAALWVAQAISAILLVLTLTWAGKRYWKVGIAMALVFVAVGFARGAPMHSSSANALVISTIALLAFASGLLAQMGNLRAEYAKDPSRALGKLMSPAQQKQFMLTVILVGVILFVAMVVLFGGFVSAKNG